MLKYEGFLFSKELKLKVPELSCMYIGEEVCSSFKAMHGVCAHI